MKRIIIIVLLLSLLLSTGCNKGPSKYEKALKCVGESTDYLREQIGLPDDIQYSPAAGGDGWNNELTYGDITVYTHLDTNGTETVTKVVKNTGEVKSDYEIALDFIGKPLADLQEMIGYPKDLRYASSCLGDGEDGELYYRGFTVYTYRDTDGSETVYDVIAK